MKRREPRAYLTEVEMPEAVVEAEPTTVLEAEAVLEDEVVTDAGAMENVPELANTSVMLPSAVARIW